MVSAHQLPQLDTEEQIQAWREERKRRYKECILKNNSQRTSKNENKSHHLYSKNTRTELGNEQIFTIQNEKHHNDCSTIKTTNPATFNPLNDFKSDGDNLLEAITGKDENDSTLTTLTRKENENKSLITQKKDLLNIIAATNATTNTNSIQMNNSCQNLIDNPPNSSNADVNGNICSNEFHDDSRHGKKSNTYKSEKSFKNNKNKRNGKSKSKSITDVSSLSRKKTLLEKLLEKDIEKEMSQAGTLLSNQLLDQNPNPCLNESFNIDDQICNSHSINIIEFDKKELKSEKEKDHDHMIVNYIADHYLTQK